MFKLSKELFQIKNNDALARTSSSEQTLLSKKNVPAEFFYSHILIYLKPQEILVLLSISKKINSSIYYHLKNNVQNLFLNDNQEILKYLNNYNLKQISDPVMLCNMRLLRENNLKESNYFTETKVLMSISHNFDIDPQIEYRFNEIIKNFKIGFLKLSLLINSQDCKSKALESYKYLIHQNYHFFLFMLADNDLNQDEQNTDESTKDVTKKYNHFLDCAFS